LAVPVTDWVPMPTLVAPPPPPPTTLPTIDTLSAPLRLVGLPGWLTVEFKRKKVLAAELISSFCFQFEFLDFPALDLFPFAKCNSTFGSHTLE
jgi:hypothetical protein